MDGLSSPNSKRGQLQRACLDLLKEHEADGSIPTSLRFLFYELVGRGEIPKAYRNPDGTEKSRKPSQDISVAVTHLRELGLVPWEWIVDETRGLTEWAYGETVVDYMRQMVDCARIDLWDGEPPPLILCESRSLSGVLKNVATRYLASIASTNGQTGGFLHTDIGPAVRGGRRVIYLGDLDYAGGHIENNTRRVLEEHGDLEWTRLAITDVQVQERGLPTISKPDHRFKPARYFDAVETEALNQGEIQRLLTERLDDMLPEPLWVVRRRENEQRVPVQETLESL